MLSRRTKNNSSVVNRFQMILAGWGLFIYIITVTGFWFISSHSIQAAFHQQAIQRAGKLNNLGARLYASHYVGNFSSVEEYISNFPEISYVKFYTVDGVDVVAQYVSDTSQDVDIPIFSKSDFNKRSNQQLKDSQPIVREITNDKSWLRVMAPVFNVPVWADEAIEFDTDYQPATSAVVTGDVVTGDVVIGYIDMGLDFGDYKSQLASNILYGSAFILIIFLVAAVAGRKLVRNILKPLFSLQGSLDKLARGETDVWVGRGGDAEIVAISNALNSTINAMKGRDAELRRLADYDGLTGLINKRSFNALLEKERERVISERDSSALFFIDLDQFKFINDTLGHASGDRLLIQIAELLSRRMRSDDVVCRLGGDEFAVLAKSVDKDGAVEIAAAIVKSMYDFLFIEQGKTFNIYCSVGVALIENNHYTAEEIFSNVDMACYSAKSQGRNRFNLFEPQALDNDKMDIGWSHRIAEALGSDKFVLHYQPIVDMAKSDISSYEVLLRMQGEEGELVPPNLFIPIAERFGLATEIDYWVIKSSMKALEKLNKIGRRSRFYINLSGQLLIDPEFVDRVIATLDTVDIEASQIVFELTERAAVGNIHTASKKMMRLKQHGFEFAVDDFGSGFSSFSYLKHMPVEYVKIEGEFIERILDDEIDRALVKSMVDIAKACGKRVVAEYVCDQPTLDLVRSYGIDYVQGFFIAGPSEEPIETELVDFAPANITVLET